MGLVLALLASGLGVLTSGTAHAQETWLRPASGVWVLDGHGFGHGRGMSQWGAAGAAGQGVGSADILAFYYPGTARSTVPNDIIRVRLSGLDTGALRVSQTNGLTVVESTGARTALPADRTQWRLVPSGTGLQLQGQVAGVWAAYPLGGLTAVPAPVRFESTAGLLRLWRPDESSTDYRGTVAAHLSGVSVTTVLSVPLESYLRGVVPAESPPSWPNAALEAQAVAARSYAVAAMRNNASAVWHICDTTACQVFNGSTRYTATGASSKVEYASTDAAIAATAGVVLTYQGAIALTEFSASNGGWTAAGRLPYQVAKPDPWDGTAPGDPVHSWKASLPVAALEARYPSVGTVTQMVVTARTGNGEWGGRVVSARLDGTAGSVTLTGEDLRNTRPYPAYADGLRSSWFSYPSDRGQVPIGRLDAASWDPRGGIRAQGWAIDPDVTTAIPVHLQIDGITVAGTTANLSRADVGAAYPAYGPNHGFDVFLPATPGTHQVCAFGINTGSGFPNSVLGCATVTTAGMAPPVGTLDVVVRTAAGLRVSGWALDTDTLDPIQVHLQVDGVTVVGAVANLPSSDPALADYPFHGNARGYSVVVPASYEAHQVCAFAINVGSGWPNSVLGCRGVPAATAAPLGVLESVVREDSGRVRVTGWALDPDTPEAIQVHLRVDGVTVGATAASAAHRVIPGWSQFGPDHGFDALVPADAAAHQVCAYAINLGLGWPNSFLGCIDVPAARRPPIGSLDAVTTVAGGVRVQGWAIDPDLPGPIQVHIQVDGVTVAGLTANTVRTDVGAAFPGYGNYHGFDGVVPASAGRHQVCAFAINVGSGWPNSWLGCANS